MNREFQIFASARDSHFVLRTAGGSPQPAFPSLFEAARHARTERNCQRGLVLVCSYCRGVDSDSDYWNQIETYLRQDTDLKLSHGACPGCFEQQVRILGLALPTATASILGSLAQTWPMS